MTRYFKNDNGSTLSIVLIVFAVLSILGLTLFSLAVSSTKNATYQENKLQSYYVARSGADATAAHIINNVTSETAMNTLINKSGNGNLEGNPFVINIQGDASNEVEIISTGAVGNTQSTATLILKKIKPFENVIHTNDDLNVVPLTSIEGNLSSNGTVTSPDGYEEMYTVTHNANIIWDEPTFPSNYIIDDINPLEVLASDDFNLIDDPTHVYDKNFAEYRYPAISINNSNILTFETDNILSVETDSLVLGSTGKIDVQGGGTVFIFVNNSAVIETGMANFYNEPSELVLFLKAGSTLTMDSNGSFKGFIYGPGATIIIGNPNTQITGAMILDSFVTTMPQNSGTVDFDFIGIESIPELKDYVKIQDGSTQYERGIWK